MPGSVSRLRAVHTSWNSCAQPTATTCDRPAAAAACKYGAITSALRSLAAKRTSGMPLACAQSLMSRRNFSPIGSNSAGDTMGLPRCSWKK
jgi:hypothetical protein